MVAATRVHPSDAFGTKSPSKKNPMSALRAAEADFTLRKTPLSEILPAGMSCLPSQHVVIREDTNTVIGQVGESYETVDNMEFFAPIAESLVEQSGAQIERFAMTNDGRLGHMRLSWADDRNIVIGRPKVGDIVARRATLSTSHDGTRCGKMVLEMLRLACLNGMTVPCGQAEFYLTHTRGGKDQLAEIIRMVPQIEAYVRQFTVAGTIMSETGIDFNDKRCLEIVSKVMDPKKSAGNKKSGGRNQSQNRIDDVMTLLSRQPGAESREIKGTAWGLFNGFADYFTHSRGENKSTEARFKALVPGKNGGAGNREIVRAWNVVVDECGVRKAIDAASALALN